MPPVPHLLPRPQEVEIVAESFRQFTLEPAKPVSAKALRFSVKPWGASFVGIMLPLRSP